jgi:REP element-mobilizing transposase RayT
MHTNDLGKIVSEEWKKIALIRPNVELDEYSVMPDHLHGIVIIEHEDALDAEHLALKDHWQKIVLVR